MSDLFLPSEITLLNKSTRTGLFSAVLYSSEVMISHAVWGPTNVKVWVCVFSATLKNLSRPLI